MLGGLKRRNTRSSGLLPSQTGSRIDGSGRSVSMDAPILRAAKNSSTYTRASYGWCFGSLWFIYYCWRSIRFNYGALSGLLENGLDIIIVPFSFRTSNHPPNNLPSFFHLAILYI